MAWYNVSWPKRFKITTDNTKVSEAVDNLFYDLNLAPSGFWSAVRSDGGDIRVTKADGETEVAREVSGFNQGSSVGSLFLKAEGLSTSVDTDFYVYYGNASATEPAADATFGKRNVWTSLLTVNHLDEASGNVTCSKSGVTGTNTGVSLGVTGKLRTAGSWDASSDRLDFQDNFDITSASFTVSAWVNPANLTQNMNILSHVEDINRNGYRLFLDSATDRPRLEIADATSFAQPGGTSSVLTASVFQHIVVTSDGSIQRFYVNGVAKGTSSNTITPTAGTIDFVLGNASQSDNDALLGSLDEVRVATVERSANWIATEFNNQDAPNTFWSTAGEESVSSVATVWIPQQRLRPRPFAPGSQR